MVNKKVVMFLLLVLISTNLLSAFEFDNVMSYDKNTETISFKNAYGLPIIGEDLAKAQLTNNFCRDGRYCEADKIINLYQEGQLIEGFRTYRMYYDGSKELQDIVNYRFEYLTNKTKYISVCSPSGNIYENGTQIMSCNLVENGTYEDWEQFNVGDVFPVGEYRVRTLGVIKRGRQYDWQVKIKGDWTTPWAIWGNITEGDEAEVILNSPEDNNISYSGTVNFNATANITSGAFLTNMSLCTNISGSWSCGDTLFITSDGTEETNLVQETDGTQSISIKKGFKFQVNKENVIINNVSLYSGVTATKAYLEFENHTTIEEANIVGGVATFTENRVLTLGNNYYITGDNSGSSYTEKYDLVADLPRNGEYINVTHGYDGSDGTNFLTLFSVVSSGLASGNYSTQTWEKNITSDLIWNVEACDTDGDCGYATENRTIFLDDIAPSLNITNPIGTINYGKIGDITDLNWSVSDVNLDSCWYDYNGTNISVSCSDNYTNFTLEEGNYNLTFYANDSLGNLESNFTSWDYKLIENYVVYNNETLEGSIENFYLNVYSSIGLSSVKMNYNGTDYNSNILSLGSGYYNISNQITIPFFSDDSNVTFFFNITLNDGTNVISEYNNQSISSVSLDNCSSYTYNLFNFTLYDERTLENIEGDIEASLTFLNQDQTFYLTNKSIIFENVTNASICSNINVSDNGYFYDLELRYYSAIGETAEYNYVPELYHIQKGNSTNFPIHIGLYDLNSDESTEFTMNYRDNNYVKRSNILLQIQRKYIDEGIYRTVEAPLTSNTGSAIGHFDLNSYKYKIIASYNGQILNVFENPAIRCESEFSGLCYLDLNGQASPSQFTSEQENEGVVYSVTQNNSVLNVDYYIPTGETKTVNVYMIQNSPTRNPILLCNNTLTSSSGSFECTANSTIGDSEVLIEIGWDDKIRRAKAYIQEDMGDFFLLNNYAIGAFFLIITITMMVSSPSIMIITSIFSLVILGLLFLIRGNSIGITLGAISWLIISGIIVLIKINKKDEQ